MILARCIVGQDQVLSVNTTDETLSVRFNYPIKFGLFTYSKHVLLIDTTDNNSKVCFRFPKELKNISLISADSKETIFKIKQ